MFIKWIHIHGCASILTLKCVTFLLCCRCACLEDVLFFYHTDSCKFKREFFISKFIGTVLILFTKKLSVESILEYPCPSPCLSSCPCLSIVGVVSKTSTLVQRHWPNIGSTLKFKLLAQRWLHNYALTLVLFSTCSGANDGQTHTSRL